MSAQARKKKKEKLKPDYSRGSFFPVKAPQSQLCSCGCGTRIERNQDCFARPYIDRGKLRGYNRIVNMDHYSDWFETMAHEYVKTIVKRHPETEEYFK